MTYLAASSIERANIMDPYRESDWPVYRHLHAVIALQRSLSVRWLRMNVLQASDPICTDSNTKRLSRRRGELIRRYCMGMAQ
jgi:hypothetical protein